MASGPEALAATVRSRLRRAALVVLGVLVALEVVYVVAGLFLVRTGQVGRWINTDPGKLLITFDSVWSVVPGVVRIRGFRIVNQGRSDQLEGTVETVWGAINPLELPANRLHVVWLRAKGVAFRLRYRPAAAEGTAALPAGVAPIEGVPWVPYSGPPPGPPGKKDGLTVVFTRARLEEVREVWIGERRLRGPGTVVASVTIGGDGTISIPHADIRFDGARLETGGEETISGLRMSVLAKVAPFDPDVPGGVQIVPLLRARVDLDARMPSGAAYLNAYLRNAPWIRFAGGEAGLAVRLVADGGKLEPGGSVELATDDLRAAFAGFTARGKARTRLDVAAGTGSPDAEARLVVEFEHYGLSRKSDAADPILEGRGLKVALQTPASLAEIPPSEFSGRLELGTAEFPRLTFLNEVLAPGGGLRILGGAGKVEGAFDVAKSGASCKGSMKVKAEGLSLDAGGVAVKGAFSLDLKVPRGDLLEQSFDVGGTLLALERFAFKTKHEKETAADWSASVAFPAARLQLGDSFDVRGSLELRASDSRPVAVFLSADAPLPGWKKKLLTVGVIKGGGRCSLSRGTLVIDDSRIAWSNMEVRARARTTQQGVLGKALVRYGVLQTGIALEGGKRKVRVLRPEAWFLER